MYILLLSLDHVFWIIDSWNLMSATNPPYQYKVIKMSILFRGFLNTWCFPMVSRLRLDSWIEWNNGAISLSPIDCRAVIISGHCDHLPGLCERKFLCHGELLLDGIHFWKIFLSNIYKWHKILECRMTSLEDDIRVITDYIEEAKDGSAATLPSRSSLCCDLCQRLDMSSLGGERHVGPRDARPEYQSWI